VTACDYLLVAAATLGMAVVAVAVGVGVVALMWRLAGRRGSKGRRRAR
jgi:hypothetical protein